MVALAKSADLEALRRETAAKQSLPQESEQPLYQLTPDGIAVISLSGPMTKYPTSFQAMLGGTSTVRVRQALRDAARSDAVSGIMLIVDSPGGSVAGTAELAGEIRGAAERKPLAAYIDDLAGSAALWAATQAPTITASRGAEVGSIGAYMVVYDQSGQAAQEGVKVYAISSAPPHKGAGVGGTEITEEQRAEWERRIKDLGDHFAAEVASGRGDRLAGNGTPMERAQALHTGRVWIADKAKELGLIDAVGSLDDAMSGLRRKIMSDTETKDALAMAAEQEQKALAAEKSLAELTATHEATVKEALELKSKLEATEREGRKKKFAAEAEALGCTVAFAETLDKIEAAAGEEVYKALKTQLAALSEQVEKGGLFSEIGSSARGESGDTGTDALTIRAKAELKAGKHKNLVDAMVAVAAEHPDLYKQHATEVGRGR